MRPSEQMWGEEGEKHHGLISCQWSLLSKHFVLVPKQIEIPADLELRGGGFVEWS